MNLFMMWMIGNQIHIMSVMMISFMVMGPFKQLFAMNESTKPACMDIHLIDSVVTFIFVLNFSLGLQVSIK